MSRTGQRASAMRRRQLASPVNRGRPFALLAVLAVTVLIAGAVFDTPWHRRWVRPRVEPFIVAVRRIQAGDAAPGAPPAVERMPASRFARSAPEPVSVKTPAAPLSPPASSPSPRVGPRATDGPVAVETRPRPASLDFQSVSAQVSAYLAKQPAGIRDTEKKRVQMLGGAKAHLVNLMNRMPYDAEGNGIRLRNGRVLRGAMVRCTADGLRVEAGRGRETEVRWSDLRFDQIVAFFDYYIRKRLEYAPAAGAGAAVADGAGGRSVRRDAASECFLLAILCDWYGHDDAAARYARLAREYDPRSAVRRYVPAAGER